MKRKIVFFLFIVLLLAGLFKLFTLVSARLVLNDVKERMVAVGALNYGGIETSVFDGSVSVTELSFKQFQYRLDVEADTLTINFGGPVGLMAGLIKGFNADYSSVATMNAKGLKTDLPNEDFYVLLSDEFSPPVSTWFGWTTCTGQQSPAIREFAQIGVKNLLANANLEIGHPMSTFELDTEGLGRWIIEMNFTNWIDGKTPFHVSNLQHIENGMFKRLENACLTSDSSDLSSRRLLASKIMHGWIETLSKQGFRISERAQQRFSDYLEQGGQLSVDLQPGGKASDEEYGWKRVLPVAGSTISVNKGAPILLDLQHYHAATDAGLHAL